MNAERTGNPAVNAWVLYDADCGFCTGLARRFQRLLARRQMELLPLQTDWVRDRLNLTDAELLAEMRVLLPDGKVFGGADAVVEISRRVWWAWPLPLLGRLPFFMSLLRSGYRHVARTRRCASGTCPIPVRHRQTQTGFRLSDFLPLLILPLVALWFRTLLAPWIFMWGMALAIYAGCKWLAYRETVGRGGVISRRRAAAFLFAWPGMNADSFLQNKGASEKPRASEWRLAAMKTLLGTALIWLAAPAALTDSPALAAWLGMIGVVFLLHFGLFHILSLLWRRFGIDALPVMRNPLRSLSLAEFWGKRWNTAFHELAFRFAYRPLRRLTTPASASLLVFLLSGIVHELVISLPAGGGYGLPTTYFLIQGIGVGMERTATGRRIGLGRGIRGWVFTVLVAGAPAGLLFHPFFLRNVILPMLQAIGAT